MNMSHKWTFSLASIFLLLAFAVVPAMAQTIEAEWTDDLDDNDTADDPGWKVTLDGLKAADTVTVTYLDVNGTAAAAAGTQTDFAAVAAEMTDSEGTIAAASGVVIAVQVVAGPSATPVTYQRVTFPAAGDDAELAKTNLVRLPKLKKLTTPNYYVNFANNEVTVVFDFEAAGTTIGAPTAPLHISDVSLSVTTDWIIHSVSGTNRVTLRSTKARNVESVNTIVSLGAVYTQAATPAVPANVPVNGTARVYYDDTAPTAAIPDTDPVRAVATPSDFQTPDIDENTQWDEDFYLSVTVIDDPNTDGSNNANVDGSGPVLTMANVSVDTTKLTVVRVGVNATQSTTARDFDDQGAAVDTDMDETDYLIHLRPRADRVTTAGEEVTITITPVDKMGNIGTPVTHKIKLAASNPVPTAVGTIAAQTVRVGAAAAEVNVASNFSDTDALTYVVSSSAPAVATATVSAAGVVSITAVAAGTATITVTASDTATPAQTVTQTIAVTVRAAPIPNPAPTAVGAIDAQTVKVGAAAVTVDVASKFSDPNDTLTYTVASSDDTKATVSVSGAVVSITAVAAGSSTITVTATDTASQTATQTIMVTVNAADSANPTAPDNIMLVNIPANSFVVLVRSNPDPLPVTLAALNFPSVPPVGGDPVDVRVWSDMPDLQDLFHRSAQSPGGALVLRQSADDAAADRPAVGTVGISEIMTGRDLGKTTATAQAAGQWIELQNLNDKAVNVMIYAQKGSDGLISNGQLGNTAAGDSLLGRTLGGMVVDAIQNIRNDGVQANGGWDVKGKEGNSLSGQPFASMHRILPHTKSKYENAPGSRFSDTKGTWNGHWAESGDVYLRGQTEATPPVLFDYRGTPGAVNNVPSISILTPVGRTGISHAVTINEVGNNSNNDYDWLELAGPAGTNLRNYMISIVTNNNSDQPLIQFPNNDNAKIAANGVFLILGSDPANDPDHAIAATGYNVDKSAEEQEPGTPNSPVRYKVMSELDLPNDGKFVLILRRQDNYNWQRSGGDGNHGVAETGNADLDKILDVAGWDDDLQKSQYPNSVSSTNVWPLYNFRDIRGFSNNSFAQDTVHQRNRVGTADGASGVGSGNNTNGQTAFGDRGWTGVGYKRRAAQTAANGGTPGYPNGALHGNGGTITGAVYISEIMYADDARGSLPQWIELRNPSPTVGADLHNWRLTITNHDSMNEAGDAYGGKGVGSVMLHGLKIKPNSSVLITSRKGPRDEVHLPDSDVFVLFPQRRGAFGQANANSDIFNTYGFTIILEAKAGNAWQLVDKVGNLAERRTPGRNERTDTERFDAPAWAWPDANTDDGARISVARRNAYGGNKDTGFSLASGTSESGWILSNMDMRTDLISPTYYGHRDDISTPGQTRGQPVPVELSYFRPTLEDGKVTIQWTTESELDNAGFNILRSDTRDGEFTQVNEQMIQGKGTTAERSTYKWVDTTAKPGVVYYYQIEDVSFAGDRTQLATTKLKGLISAKGKLTTQWGNLKNLR